METIPLIVIKKDNNRETYDRTKIEAGVLRACHKRPISASQITQLVDEVETEIFNMEEREISSQVIGIELLKKLREDGFNDLEVIILSGYKDFDFAMQGLKYGYKFKSSTLNCLVYETSKYPSKSLYLISELERPFLLQNSNASFSVSK